MSARSRAVGTSCVIHSRHAGSLCNDEGVRSITFAPPDLLSFTTCLLVIHDMLAPHVVQLYSVIGGRTARTRPYRPGRTWCFLPMVLGSTCRVHAQ